MSHTSDAKPGPPPRTAPVQISPEIAYQAGAVLAKNQAHPNYDAAAADFQSTYGDRQLKAFEQGYYDGSCGWVK